MQIALFFGACIPRCDLALLIGWNPADLIVNLRAVFSTSLPAREYRIAILRDGDRADGTSAGWRMQMLSILSPDAITGGALVVLFPEGTSSDGSTVLPFKSALLESPVELRCRVASAAIEYALDDGSVADEMCYWRGMTLVPHFT